MYIYNITNILKYFTSLIISLIVKLNGHLKTITRQINKNRHCRFANIPFHFRPICSFLLPILWRVLPKIENSFFLLNKIVMAIFKSV